MCANAGQRAPGEATRRAIRFLSPILTIGVHCRHRHYYLPGTNTKNVRVLRVTDESDGTDAKHTRRHRIDACRHIIALYNRLTAGFCAGKARITLPVHRAQITLYLGGLKHAFGYDTSLCPKGGGRWGSLPSATLFHHPMAQRPQSNARANHRRAPMTPFVN